jgi:hypothetical protein
MSDPRAVHVVDQLTAVMREICLEQGFDISISLPEAFEKSYSGVECEGIGFNIDASRVSDEDFEHFDLPSIVEEAFRRCGIEASDYFAGGSILRQMRISR